MGGRVVAEPHVRWRWRNARHLHGASKRGAHGRRRPGAPPGMRGVTQLAFAATCGTRCTPAPTECAPLLWREEKWTPSRSGQKNCAAKIVANMESPKASHTAAVPRGRRRRRWRRRRRRRGGARRIRLLRRKAQRRALRLAAGRVHRLQRKAAADDGTADCDGGAYLGDEGESLKYACTSTHTP